MQNKISTVVGSLLFIPFAFIALSFGALGALMFTTLIPFGGGLIGFFLMVVVIIAALKAYEWSMAFDRSSRGILLPVVSRGFRDATRMNAWQAGLLISSSLFAVGLLWNFLF